MLKQLMFAAFAVFIAGCGTGNSMKPAIYEQEKPAIVYDPYSKSDVSSIRTFTSPNELVEKVKALGGEQGKFESNSDFFARARLGAFEACYPAAEAGFKFDPATGIAKYEYSLTDAQLLGYRENANSLIPNIDFSYPSVFLSSDTIGKDAYVGSNAFGVKVDIAKADLVRTYLVFAPYARSQYGAGSIFLESEPLKGDDFSDMKVCITSVPVEPYFRVKHGYHQPTINVPIDGKIDDYFFRVQIAGMSLVSKAGKLYSMRMSAK